MIDRFFEHDEDGDGRLSREEMPQRARRLFDRADTDQDGMADRAEVESALAKKKHGRSASAKKDRTE